MNNPVVLCLFAARGTRFVSVDSWFTKRMFAVHLLGTNDRYTDNGNYRYQMCIFISVVAVKFTE